MVIEMITCEQVTEKIISCDSCNKETRFSLKYNFIDKLVNGGSYPYEMSLCEDCSNGLSNLHRKVMENGIKHKYNINDRYIKEIK